MKIFVSAYACEPYYGSEPGIGWNFCNEMCKHHDIWVLTRANNQPVIDAYYATHGGCPESLHFLYYDVPKWLSFWKRKRLGYRQYYYIWQIGAYLKWRKFVNENGFDLVHHLTFANIAMPALFMCCKPITIWGPIGFFPIPKPIMEALPRRIRWQEKIRKGIMWTMMHLDPLHVITEYAADCIIEEPNRYFESCFRKHSKIRNLYQTGLNSNDPDYLLPKREPRKDGKTRLIICSEFFHWKGVTFACEVFGRIAEKRDDVELIIYGRGSEEGEMRRILAKHHVEDKTTWHGYVKKHEMLKALQNADVFLYPTYHHGLATIVLQAMYAGIPMVGMAGDAVADTIADGFGLVAEGNSMKEILDDLERKTLQLIDSPELRQTCISRGRELLEERFNWSTMVDRMCELYADLGKK